MKQLLLYSWWARDVTRQNSHPTNILLIVLCAKPSKKHLHEFLILLPELLLSLNVVITLLTRFFYLPSKHYMVLLRLTFLNWSLYTNLKERSAPLKNYSCLLNLTPWKHMALALSLLLSLLYGTLSHLTYETLTLCCPLRKNLRAGLCKNRLMLKKIKKSKNSKKFSDIALGKI